MYAGWASFGRAEQHRGTGPDTATLLSRLAPFHTPDRIGTIQLDRFTAVQAITFNTPESHDEVLPSICPATGNVLVSWIRLDNRAELGRALEISGHKLKRATDPDLVLAAYRRWGVDCANKLEGDFSFALWDKRREALFLARDSIGVKPLFYAETDDAIAFATTAACFSDYKTVDTTPNPVWLARYISLTSKSFTETPFPGVHKLAPGHWLFVDRGETAHIRRFHEFVDDAPWSNERDPRWAAEYRQLLEESVRNRLRSSYPQGAETSGGLDSSTIVGLIAHLDESQRRTLQTYGHALCPDEPRYILETSMSHGIRRNNILTHLEQPNESSAIRSTRMLGYPVEHFDAIAYIPFFAMAHGSQIRTMHSGFGGDEMVTNPGTQLTSELLTNHQWRLALRELPGHPAARPRRLLKRTRHHFKSGTCTPTTRSWVAQRLANSLVHHEILEATGILTQWADDSRFPGRYRTINKAILDDRMAPSVPTRTEQFTLVAASYGIEYRWALLDRQLMQAYLSTPAIEKWGKGFGRYLHRRAISDILPESVAWKPSKRMGVQPPPATRDTHFLPWPEIHPAIQLLVNGTKYQSLVDQSGRLRHPEELPPLAGGSLDSIGRLSSWFVDR